MMDFETGIVIATLWQECRGVSDPQAIFGVCHVLQNRTARGYASNGTLIDTCLRAYQFSGWLDANTARVSLMRAPYAETLQTLWRQSLGNPDPTCGAVLYYSPDSMIPKDSVPSWVGDKSPSVVLGPFRFYLSGEAM